MVTEWFDAHENNVNHMPLWSQSPDQPNLTLMGDSGPVPESFPPPLTKPQMMEFLVEEWCRVPPIEFQTLVESMPRRTEAVVAPRPIKKLWFLLICQLPVCTVL